MVQIAEYTRRDTFSATERPGLNLNMPDAMARASSSSIGGINVDDMRAVAKGAKEIAGNMLEMKERYDKARVNEYLNNYMQNAQSTILGYKKDRLGKNANGVVSDFEKWSEKEFDMAMGRSDDTTKEPLLENREQINLAREQMDKLNLNYINNLSSFQAEQIQKYEDNQATALLTNQATMLSSEHDDLSISNSILTMKQTASELSALNGQSQEYVDMYLKPMISKSLAQNVMSVAINNPDFAISKMENKLFSGNMEKEDYDKTSENIIKAFKNYYSDVLSDGVSYDQEGVKRNIRTAVDRTFFEKYGKDKILNDVVIETEKKFKEKTEKRHQEGVALQNEIVLKMSNNGFDINALSTEDFALLASTEGGIKAERLIKHIQTATLNEDYNIRNGGDIIEATEEQNIAYSEIKNRIDDGYYETLGELYDEVVALTPDQQKEVVGKFVNDLKYKKDVDALKSRGIDVEDKISEMFEYTVGLDVNKSRNYFDVYKNLVVEQLRGEQLNGKKIDYDLVKRVCSNVADIVATKTTDESTIHRIIRDVDKLVAMEFTGTNIASDSDWMDKAEDVLDDSDLGDLFTSEETERAFLKLIVNGNVDSALSMIRERRKNLSMEDIRTQKFKQSVNQAGQNTLEYRPYWMM